MATTTSRLALRKPELTDQVNVDTDLSANFDKVDAAVGATICTSTTRPASPYQGQFIFETDTSRTYVRSGAAWVQALPSYSPPAARVDAPVVLTDGATVSTNAALGNFFRVTLGGNRTLANPTGAVDGQKLLFELIQDATGSRTITLGTKFAFGTDVTSVVLTTTAAKRDYLGVIYNAAADKFYVTGLAKGY